MLEEAVVKLRRELMTVSIATEDRDVFWAPHGDPVLSLAPGLVIWIGLQHGFRWVGGDGRWKSHPLTAPAGAARLIAALYPACTCGFVAERPCAPV
ncbi:hypothetical protein [Streptosporangium sp. NPDC051022]|uniref:hypothetical protein n=1 Tax=Streptosporangium sp. NPDC051022 TaxID=3155752 RepID=UPI0034144A18